MKKVAIIAALVLFFGFGAASYAAEPREFISETMPEEVAKMVDNAQVMTLDQQPISTAGTDVYDYGILYSSTYENYLKYFSEGREPTVDVISVFALTPVKNEQGIVVDYTGEIVGVVFNIENVKWFKNAKVKEVFEKATK